MYEKEKGSLPKRILGAAAGALLFGVVAGAVMTGISAAFAPYLIPKPAVREETVVQNIQPLPPRDPRPQIQVQYTVEEIAQMAMPSVVAITSTAEYEAYNPFLPWFFGGESSEVYEVPSSGSGIIVGQNETELLIATNYHVIEDASSLQVAFIDDKNVEATVKGTDPDMDLAVVSVALSQMEESTRSAVSVAKLVDSQALKVGQGVVAIGNALGYGQSVTVGYISALNRQIQSEGKMVQDLLQTDAAINPGNSGGALLNMQGEVIGINSAKYSSTEVEGMGYAIPISSAEGILGELMNRRSQNLVPEQERGYLGIQGTTVDYKTSQALGMPQGAYVYKTLEGGAAQAAGIREKDIITRFDGQTIRSMNQLQEILSYYAAGEQVEVLVMSLENGEYRERQITMTLAPMPESAVQK